MENPVGWFEIYVEDMERAKSFYEGVFGCNLENLNMPELEMWAFPMEMGGTGAAGSLVKMEGVKSGNNSTLVYFNCDDCAVESKKASECGGKIEREKFSIGEHGFISLVLDTEGNMIGLHSRK